MARYPNDHKQRTRAHLVETARREFRSRGFDAASIDTLMKAAGLTRGGFYAHFESKEALITEVLELEPGLLRLLSEASSSNEPRADANKAFVQYLDPEKRDDRVQCPLVAHPMDAKRGGPSRAGLYTDQVRSLVESVDQITGERDSSLRVAIVAIGAAILGTAITDEALADEIDAAAKAALSELLDGVE